MPANMETPAKLASQVIADIKQGAESVLDACSKIAAAFEAIDDNGAWTEKQFIDFIDRLSEANIGPGSSVFVSVDKKGVEKFSRTPKASVYYRMMSVGCCKAFNLTEFRKYNRTTSYNTLYRLSVLYNYISEKTSGSEKIREERAEKAVLNLVEQYGADLTRNEVDAALEKVKAQRRSFAPQEIKDPANIKDEQTTQNKVSLDEIIEKDIKYDLLFITPSEKDLQEAANLSIGDLADKARFSEISKQKAQTVLVGKGRQLEGLKNLAHASGNLKYVYCVREANDKNTIIDLSEELVVFTSNPLNQEASRKKNETVPQYVQRLIEEGASQRAKKLHLFAEAEEDGWDICKGSDSYSEG
jgi:hypothetical protein